MRKKAVWRLQEAHAAARAYGERDATVVLLAVSGERYSCPSGHTETSYPAALHPLAHGKIEFE